MLSRTAFTARGKPAADGALTAPEPAPDGDGEYVVEVALKLSEKEQIAFTLKQRGMPEPASFGIRMDDGRTFVP